MWIRVSGGFVKNFTSFGSTTIILLLCLDLLGCLPQNTEQSHYGTVLWFGSEVYVVNYFAVEMVLQVKLSSLKGVFILLLIE